MAGLYDVWKNPDGKIVPTYTVITKASQEDIAEIYGRMPAVLPSNELDVWLKSQNNPKDALKFAENYRPVLDKHPVSNLVNSVKNNSPECNKPV